MPSQPRVESRTLKVGVVGCGALGSYYGARLALFGHDVHFLLRSDYEAVRRGGVTVLSNQGNFNARPRCARRPEEIGPCDWVIIGLKSTANAAFAELLPPLVGEHTAILTLQNGLGNEEALATLFPVEQILGGLCFVCLNRLKPGVIQHIAHGRIAMGEFQRWPEPRTHDLATHFRNAGVPCEVTENLAKAHWEKLVWNIPFNGLGVASSAGFDSVLEGRIKPDAVTGKCLTTDVLLGDPKWEALVREIMREVIAVGNLMGLQIAASWEENQIDHTRGMGPYRASTLVDFEKRLPLELESLFLEPLRQAKAVGASVPRLSALCRVLVELDRSLGESRPTT